MQRPIDSDLMAAFRAGHLCPIVLASLTFRSKTEYVWTGVGVLAFGGNNYIGVGAVGRIGTNAEGTDVRADGMTVGLTRVNPDLYQECVADIQQGLPAKLYAGALSKTGQIIGVPYLFFSGWVDDADFDLDPQNMTIVLNLENVMADLQRAPMLRLTSADQSILYPTDSSMDWQPMLTDAPLRWGGG